MAISNPDVITDPVTGSQYAIGASGTYQKYTGAPVITPDALGTTGKLSIPLASTYNSSAALVDGVKATLPSTTAANDAQKQIDLGYGRLDSFYQKLGTKGSATQDAYDQYGVTGDTDKLKEINLQIAQKTAAFDKMSAALEGQGNGIPLSIITSQQGAVSRQKAAEIGALGSVAQALQGNIQLSKQLADEAVENEFADVETDIDRTKLFIQQNQDKFTAAQKEQADQVNQYLDDYKDQVADQKQDRKDILSYASEVAQQGYPDLAQRISQQTDINTAFAMASPYIGQLQRENTQSTIAKRTGSGGGTAASTAASKADVQKLLTSGYGTQFAGRGSDGFVDPNAYIYAFQHWGGTTASFLTAFPPEKNVNPASYSILPAALQTGLPASAKKKTTNPFAT